LPHHNCVFGVVHFAYLFMANQTKAEIQNELLDVKAQLDARDQELLALKDQLAAVPDSAPRLPGFADRVWLPENIDEIVTNQDGSTWRPVSYGTTKNGSRFIEWKAQVSHCPKKGGKRTYSKTRIPFQAWNEQCDQIMSLIKDGNRLVDITANFLPDTWEYQGKEYSKDFWYVTSVDPFVRQEDTEPQGTLDV